jgi:hypothetical protein
MRGTMSRRLSSLLLTSASVAALSLAWAPSPALAEKVGVTSAVKPDAFSDGAPVKIGASVFYNQRINTSGSGVVQVLLVDGSTFTVDQAPISSSTNSSTTPRRIRARSSPLSARACCASSAGRFPRTRAA